MFSTLPNSSLNHSRLLADIGGTNARFCLETESGKTDAIWVAECGQYPTIGAAISTYLTLPTTIAAGGEVVKRAGIAVATPINSDVVRMTNNHWAFSIQEMQAQFGWEALTVTNDFTALAHSLPYLLDTQKNKIGGGAAQTNAAIGLVGPGTGLGVSGLIPCGAQWVALNSEGGHTNFAPTTDTEVEILNFARQRFSSVSNERFLSGPGLVLIHEALTQIRRRTSLPITPPEILENGLNGSCDLCREAIDTFCGMLGTVAGNLAITLGSQGGVYIGGGIVPRLGHYFAESAFRARFENKGRFTHYLAEIPTYVISEQFPAFIGLSAMLARA